MDTTVAQHFLMVLERIREEQIQQNALLQGIGVKLDAILAARATESWLSRVERCLPLLKPIASAAAQYAIGILVIAYALKGGDLMTAVEALLKLL
jgi:hypothetical protein